MDVSILIVNYNTCKLTVDCLQSVYASTDKFTYEVIVIDNNSQDNSVQTIREQYPQVKLIVNNHNVGYARANNQGLKIAQGRYMLLLNSDTIIQKNTIEIMVAFMDRNLTIGASGCKIILPNGSLDKACKRGFPTPSSSFYYAFGFSRLFPNKPRFNQYQLGYLDPDTEYPVDCLVGAFMMVRLETFREVGGLDEDFFMYGEDIDWCYRIKQAGWSVHYYPRTTIVHYKGASARRKPYKIVYEFHRSMILFYRKHYRKRYNILINGGVYTGIIVKMLISLLMNRIRSITSDSYDEVRPKS